MKGVGWSMPSITLLLLLLKDDDGVVVVGVAFVEWL